MQSYHFNETDGHLAAAKKDKTNATTQAPLNFNEFEHTD
jgi:hypothetical protein